MALEDNVLKLRKDALAKRRKPTLDAYQGEIDRYALDRCDTVFALLDDEHDSWFNDRFRESIEAALGGVR